MTESYKQVFDEYVAAPDENGDPNSCKRQIRCLDYWLTNTLTQLPVISQLLIREEVWAMRRVLYRVLEQMGDNPEWIKKREAK